MEIDHKLIPSGQFCETVIEYIKESDDGFGNKTPAIHHVCCQYLVLNIISGFDNLKAHSPFCWVCAVNEQALVEKELTSFKPPIKICGIKDQSIPEELLTLSFDEISKKSDEELKEINKKLKEHHNVS